MDELVTGLLTFLVVTLPRWVRFWTEPLPVVMPAAWMRRQAYEEGKRGEW